jgi:hypothetical protein
VLRTLTLAALAGAALVAAAPVAAEMPRNTAPPEVTGPALAGYALVGHNGTWLYADGSACGAECSYAFAWQRCGASGCVLIPGANDRVYRLGRDDLGAEFRVVVTTTKYDCGEWNYSTGMQECRFVTRTAESPAAGPVARGVVRGSALVRSVRLLVEAARTVPRRPRPGSAFTLEVTVADAFGRLVAGARVSAQGRVATTNGGGVAALRLRAPARRRVVTVGLSTAKGAAVARRPIRLASSSGVPRGR